MRILTIRTDKPEAEIGLYDDQTQLAYETWHAHRELSITLHQKMQALLAQHNATWSDVQAIVAYAGPGSFTGLRIGLTVANALAYGLHIPVLATQHEDWIEAGIQRLLKGETDVIALPEYGSPAHVTVQKK